MEICVVSSSDNNIFASALLCRLAAYPDINVSVLCVRKTYGKVLLNSAIKKMLRLIFKNKISNRSMTGENETELTKYYMSKYFTHFDSREWSKPISVLCGEHGIRYKRISSVNSDEAVSFILRNKTDLILNAGGGIYKQPMIGASRIGILNTHMASLPLFRGMNVLEWSIFYGYRPGVTACFINDGIDTGDTLLFREIQIEKGDTISRLRAKSTTLNIELMIECIESIKTGMWSSVKQRPEDGKQYFSMHPRLKDIVERKIKDISVLSK